MQSLVLLLLIFVIFVSAFGYRLYCHNAEKRAREKRRNQFHDRGLQDRDVRRDKQMSKQFARQMSYLPNGRPATLSSIRHGTRGDEIQ